MLAFCDFRQQMQKVLNNRSTFIYSHTTQGMLQKQRYDGLQGSASLRAVQSKMQTSRSKPSLQERGFASSYGMMNLVKDMPNKYLLKANPLTMKINTEKSVKQQIKQEKKQKMDWGLFECIFTFLFP